MRFRARKSLARGFTLIEVAIAIVVVGVGIVAVQAMVASSTRSTAINDEIQTAGMLARAMHERCLNLDRTALQALKDVEFSPPLDSQAQPLTDLSSYRQRVEVSHVDPINLSGTSAATATGLMRVTVTVSHKGKSVIQSSRLLATTRQD